MPLDTSTQVTQLERVQNEAGSTVVPASGEFVHQPGENIDINSSTEVVDMVAPDRAEAVVIHVEVSGAAHVELQFHAQNDYSGEFTQRDQNENADYSVGAAGDIYVVADLASPYVRVRIVDDSGAANSTDYNLYIR